MLDRVSRDDDRHTRLSSRLQEAQPAQVRTVNQRLSDFVAERLREMILDGPLNSGDPIAVPGLARQLGVSRQPVMEALKRIEADGAIEILPQVGCRVRRPTADEIEDFFQMFAAMEAEMSALAAERHTEEQAANFSDLLANVIRSCHRRGSAQSDRTSHRRLNRAFHGAIHEMAGAPNIARLSSALWNRSDFYVKTAFGDFRISPRVRDEYARISEAILERNADAARAATRRHLITSGRDAGNRIRSSTRSKESE